MQMAARWDRRALPARMVGRRCPHRAERDMCHANGGSLGQASPTCTIGATPEDRLRRHAQAAFVRPRAEPWPRMSGRVLLNKPDAVLCGLGNRGQWGDRNQARREISRRIGIDPEGDMRIQVGGLEINSFKLRLDPDAAQHWQGRSHHDLVEPGQGGFQFVYGQFNFFHWFLLVEKQKGVHGRAAPAVGEIDHEQVASRFNGGLVNFVGSTVEYRVVDCAGVSTIRFHGRFSFLPGPAISRKPDEFDTRTMSD
jgi:hypothetical protein